MATAADQRDWPMLCCAFLASCPCGTRDLICAHLISSWMWKVGVELHSCGELPSVLCSDQPPPHCARDNQHTKIQENEL